MQNRQVVQREFADVTSNEANAKTHGRGRFTDGVTCCLMMLLRYSILVIA